MVLQFAVNLIMARLLVPADFGAIGMLAIFIAVSQILIDGGFGSALIQKKEPTQRDFSTIFIWNLVFSLFLYLLLFLLAPIIGKFYSMPVLSDVLRVIGLNLVITSLLSIQITRLRKQLAFRTIAVTNLGAYIAGGLIAVLMAINEFGVWSLVAMQLSQSVIAVFILWLITRWRPSFCFSKRTMKELFGFGGYIMAANILQEISKNLQGIVIGKKFSAAQMGYYSQAYKLDQIFSYSIPQVIIQVMYPVYSSLQDNKEKLISTVLMNLRIIAYTIFPLLAILILIADPLIPIIFGKKWQISVQYYRILCIGGFFVSLQNIFFYAIAAIGQSKVLFKWSFYKWSFLIMAIFVGVQWGMLGLMWGIVFSNFNILLVNSLLSTKLTGIKFTNQIKSLYPIVINVIICFIICYIVQKKEINFILLSLIYISIYLTISVVFKSSALKETIHIIEIITKRKKL